VRAKFGRGVLSAVGSSEGIPTGCPGLLKSRKIVLVAETYIVRSGSVFGVMIAASTQSHSDVDVIAERNKPMPLLAKNAFVISVSN
jgi:hypothetical protein